MRKTKENKKDMWKVERERKELMKDIKRIEDTEIEKNDIKNGVFKSIKEPL